jgi:hypothetical protein
MDSLRARKSFAALPFNHPFAAKHMLFCLPGLRHLAKFVITQNSNPFTGILKPEFINK